MSGRIIRLDDAVANQIAAGEVVERPASVVKELVENALDAEAARVTVRVAGGGADRIEVVDDGIGMSAEDAVLCLERHATSKIRSAHDLSTVRTLGFRGEAVPSIASVSRFTLVTRARGADAGTEVRVEGGRIDPPRTVGAAEGTSIDVRDLFFNVPARKKFLKRPATELGHIHEAIVRLALARPKVGFVLESEGRASLEIPPGGDRDPGGRLSRILGKKVGAHLYPLPDADESYAIRVTGYVSSPELTERTTRGLYVFVNGRFVRDRTIQHAIQDAYRTLMERGRHPVVVLFVDLPPDAFDVNVHPQKTEIRFVRTQDVHRAVTHTLHRTLAGQPWLGGAPATARAPVTRTYILDSGPTEPSEPAGGTPALDGASRLGPGRSAAAVGGVAREGGGVVEHARRMERALIGARPGAGSKAVGRYLSGARAPSLATELDFVDAPREQPALSGGGGRFSSLEPVGQVMGTYLVCQEPGRMVIVDQHAAHERIAFERMRRQRRGERVSVQPLLVPQAIELDAGRAGVAESERERLAEIGVELEPFGGDTWMIKTSPVALGQVKLEGLVLDLLDELREVDQTTPYDERMDALLSCAACHTAVRAGDRLSNLEIASLLTQMDEIDFGAHCPHGRPVFVEYTERELAKMFHRT